MRSIAKYLAAVIPLCGVAAVLNAQQAAPTKPAEPKYTEIKYAADKSSYRWEGEDRILVLAGHVKFVQGDTTITADKVDYRESTKIANAAGNLKIYDGQNTITGDSCTMSFKEKKGSVVGNVSMVAKPKPKQNPPADAKKSEWKDEVAVTCAAIDYYYKDKKAVVPSALTIIQKGRTITADSATYLGKDEVLQLVGNVKGHDDKENHSFAAPRVTISLRDNNEWMQAEKASGTFYVKDEDEPTPPEKTAEKPTDKETEKPKE